MAVNNNAAAGGAAAGSPANPGAASGSSALSSLEQGLKDLEALTAQLESGSMSIDDAIRVYTQGMKLAVSCRLTLDALRQKVTVAREQARLEMNQGTAAEGSTARAVQGGGGGAPQITVPGAQPRMSGAQPRTSGAPQGTAVNPGAASGSRAGWNTYRGPGGYPPAGGSGGTGF